MELTSSEKDEIKSKASALARSSSAIDFDTLSLSLAQRAVENSDIASIVVLECIRILLVRFRRDREERLCFSAKLEAHFFARF